MADELLRRLREEIRASGPISFARFMDLALHDPVDGYYARGSARLGRAGDFFTASDVGPVLGDALARFLVELDGALSHPKAFRYVEHGAGRGRLACDVREALAARDPGLAARLDIELSDASAGMRAAAREACPGARVVSPPECLGGGEGCVVAVELFDALPVHRVRRRGSRLVEVRVALSGDRLAEVESAAPAEVADAAERYGLASEDGDETEVCLALPTTLRALAASIDRGFLLVIDYGHEAERLARPAHRRGTLLAYSRHAVNEDYLERVGEQDLTAHVNLTMLRDEAERLGLRTLRVTTQDRFLIANGVLDGLDEAGDSLVAVKRRLQVKQLAHPGGMGGIFKVAVFSKNLDGLPDLPGLRDPFA